jgi:hypothetical protein
MMGEKLRFTLKKSELALVFEVNTMYMYMYNSNVLSISWRKTTIIIIIRDWTMFKRIKNVKGEESGSLMMSDFLFLFLTQSESVL